MGEGLSALQAGVNGKNAYCMPFFLDYEAEGRVVGHVRVPCASAEEAFLYAKDALRDMNCLKAVLRCSESIGEFNSGWGVIARYTHACGWER